MCTVSAAHLFLDDDVISSPELALVDADLAARLRADLATEDVFRPRSAPQPALVAIAAEPHVVDLDVGAADAIVPVTGLVDDDGPSVDDLIVDHEEVDEVQDEPVRVADPSSDYPALPALDGRIDVLEETETALRMIREQMVEEQSARKTRVRRRLAVVFGLGVAAALAVLAVDVQLGVAHLPGF
jgi:hypothetical protein